MYQTLVDEQVIVKIVRGKLKLLMIAPLAWQSMTFIHALMVPPWVPHVSGIVIQAMDKSPKSRYWDNVMSVFTALLACKLF